MEILSSITKQAACLLDEAKKLLYIMKQDTKVHIADLVSPQASNTERSVHFSCCGWKALCSLIQHGINAELKEPFELDYSRRDMEAVHKE